MSTTPWWTAVNGHTYTAPSAGVVHSSLRCRVHSLFFPKGVFRVFVSGSHTSLIANILLGLFLPIKYSSLLCLNPLYGFKKISSKNASLRVIIVHGYFYATAAYWPFSIIMCSKSSNLVKLQLVVFIKYKFQLMDRSRPL